LVLELQLRRRLRLAPLAIGLALASPALGDTPTPAQYLHDADTLYARGQYFESARYAFAAAEENDSAHAEAYARITLSLAKAGLPNSASYFFIRTLQSGDKTQIRRVLTGTEDLIAHVGGDLLRPYLIEYTKYEDYDLVNRSAYLYSLGKDALLRDALSDAVGYFSAISQRSQLYPYALQLRATAYAILKKDQQALGDFKACQDRAFDPLEALPDRAQDSKKRQAAREGDDLHSRCVAGEARTLYQMGRFDEAERVYDRIPKASFVWPDILFEQAWNAFGKQEYNRTLGKLVTYKSPALKFVYNSEVDVLRAQSYFALCLYSDVNGVVNEFHGKYDNLARDIKGFVEANRDHVTAFYDFGRDALKSSLYSQDLKFRMANRFVRSPYFQNLVASEREINREALGVRSFASLRGGTPGRGFAGFLEHVLGWRIKVIRMLGGSFIRNSLIDYHDALIADLEKMGFIKIEMLRRAKDAILKRPSPGMDRAWGNIEPSRRDDQYYWTFNGEFWNDELGDYVFGLESQCAVPNS
jgi:tetratricopeptide (TPR) repeat protein